MIHTCTNFHSKHVVQNKTKYSLTHLTVKSLSNVNLPCFCLSVPLIQAVGKSKIEMFVNLSQLCFNLNVVCVYCAESPKQRSVCEPPTYTNSPTLSNFNRMRYMQHKIVLDDVQFYNGK